jgi:hypothetical protein
MKLIICPRCSGHGKIEKYNHVEAGVCFKCNGAGKIEVEDNIRDTVQELRDERKKYNELEKEFNNLWEQYKNELKDNRQWYWYILCEGTEHTTKDEERLTRINQYLQYKEEKELFKKTINVNIIDIDEAMKHIKEIESKYLYSRE